MEKRNLILASLVIAVFLSGLSSALASLPPAPLPSGGSSFDAAVELSPGAYEGELGVALPSGPSVQDSTQYFYVKGLKAGQEISASGSLKGKTSLGSSVTFGLYDEDRKEVDKNGVAAYDAPASINLAGLANSEKYYVTVKVDGPATSSITLSVSDKYDAGSSTDAGGEFESAMAITPGRYTGYLAGGKGSDTVDTYRVSAKKGVVLTVEANPKSNALMKVAVYDLNKQLIEEKTALNPGAAVRNSVGITKDEDIYVAVTCDGGCSNSVVEYTLSFPGSGGGAGTGGQGGSQEQSWFPSIDWKMAAIAVAAFIAVVIILSILIYFLFLRKKKYGEMQPEYSSGGAGATESIVGYKHPCRYCDKMIPPNSNVCPLCGKSNPLGPLRCPKCKNPVQKDWQKCPGCGLSLTIDCPKCGKKTFFGEYCDNCGEEIKVFCPYCDAKQPPVGDKCVRCGKSLK
ncbi:MAG: zinc ribbon domain-containing protein [Candidatus Altiarchaeota archaeon]|nr:zinc ribbon domain-containing protein [Candidatus Altiarchaeota archaeon]